MNETLQLLVSAEDVSLLADSVYVIKREERKTERKKERKKTKSLILLVDNEGRFVGEADKV